MPHKQPRRLDGVHVLLVEDDDDSRDVLEMVLRYCGAIVTAVASALEAIRYVTRTTPAVVVTDIMMPGQDGFWLLATVRSQPHTKAIPIVAVTAHDDTKRVRAAGFDSFLRKPVDMGTLCDAIHEAMRRPA